MRLRKGRALMVRQWRRATFAMVRRIVAMVVMRLGVRGAILLRWGGVRRRIVGCQSVFVPKMVCSL